MFPTILIIDDEPSILQSLSGLLTDEGFEVLTASNGYEGLKRIEAETPDLVLLDIWMPGLDGIETLKEIKSRHPWIQVIIITGHGNIETAVKATKLGAYNLIEKPLSIDKVILDINNALNFRRLEEENRYLRKKTIDRHAISGNSPATQELRKQIAAVAPIDAWVLITGENGTGKELVARTIHQLSRRAEQPLMDINCAAIPEDRIESELFGHEKGVTEWDKSRKHGRFEMANTGTLFLDEIGDMPLPTQARLLRVIQEQAFQRLGGGRTLRVDVRIVAASNKNLESEIAAGRFREDLYHRLNQIPIHVPPLRQRKEDLPALVRIFLDSSAQKDGQVAKRITPEAMALLVDYDWPGNVRELKNLIGRLAVMLPGGTINAGDLPSPYNPANAAAPVPEHSLYTLKTLAQARSLFEMEFIRRKLSQNDQDILRTAASIGISHQELIRKLALEA